MSMGKWRNQMKKFLLAAAVVIALQHHRTLSHRMHCEERHGYRETVRRRVVVTRDGQVSKEARMLQSVNLSELGFLPQHGTAGDYRSKCEELCLKRNAYFANAGYAFKTAPAIRHSATP